MLSRCIFASEDLYPGPSGSSHGYSNNNVNSGHSGNNNAPTVGGGNNNAAGGGSATSGTNVKRDIILEGRGTKAPVNQAPYTSAPGQPAGAAPNLGSILPVPVSNSDRTTLSQTKARQRIARQKMKAQQLQQSGMVAVDQRRKVYNYARGGTDEEDQEDGDGEEDVEDYVDDE